MSFLPQAVLGGSPFDADALRLSATSIVATAHWAARSFRLVARGCRPFSAEIEHTGSISGRYEPHHDEISATGSPQSFALFRMTSHKEETASFWKQFLYHSLESICLLHLL